VIGIDDTLRRWDESALGALTEEAIRSLYQPSTRYRVSRFTLPPEDSSVGGMFPAFCFCLRGNGRFQFGDRTIALSEGEYVRLPGGRYLKESDDDVFDIVLVIELPPELWR